MPRGTKKASKVDENGKRYNEGKSNKAKLNVGNPGNKGGGRSPDDIRILARKLGYRIIEEVQRRIEDPTKLETMSPSDLRALFDSCLKYGVGAAQPGPATNQSEEGSASKTVYISIENI